MVIKMNLEFLRMLSSPIVYLEDDDWVEDDEE